LQRTTPLVGNYSGRNVIDLLTPEQYNPIYTNEQSITGSKRRVQKLYKFKVDSENTENMNLWEDKTTYIIEGVLRENRKSTTTSSDDLSKWYNKSSFFTAVKDFIDILIDIFSKILPNINNLLNLFKSPFSFIF